jgi:hypothetical protein
VTDSDTIARIRRMIRRIIETFMNVTMRITDRMRAIF